MQRLGLNCIVKNEEKRILRMLNSVRTFISCAVVVDTGSTDKTIEVMSEWFKAAKIDYVIDRAPFENWAQARNAALDAAYRYAKADGDQYRFDYLLLCDADMELRANPAVFEKLDAKAYAIQQRAGTLHYDNARLLKVDALPAARYLGVTHEFLNVATVRISPDAAHFIDHADGANRNNKALRDAGLLRHGLEADPTNARYMFYLAQSYRDAAGATNIDEDRRAMLEKAIRWYRRRIAGGGWDEEIWCSQIAIGECYKMLGKDNDFVAETLQAYRLRPSRVESLHALAKYYREKGQVFPAFLFAEQAIKVPRTTDSLFVNDYAYDVGAQEEFMISAFYIPGKREEGFRVADHLSLKPGPYEGARNLARHNLFFYLPTLKEVCSTFEHSKVDWTPPEHWASLNPSITRVGDEMKMIIRTVNYRMDDQGRYLIRATDGTANNTNPINTRSYLCDVEQDLSVRDPKEIVLGTTMPCEYPLVIGFEDMRLFAVGTKLWTSSTVRQIHPDGNCEQVLARIDFGTDIPEIVSPVIKKYKRMLREPRSTQKNWSPVVTDKGVVFMFRPGHTVDVDGKDVTVYETDLTVDVLSGSSQVIPFRRGASEWIAIVHEARQTPNSPLRYYQHRFVTYDADFKLNRLSRPFVFQDKVIEFCAGMCWHPDNEHLVISYGFRDAEARLGKIHAGDVERLLCQSD